MSSVLVLAGGPGAEREVSIDSARAVALALGEAGCDVHEQIIDRPTAHELERLPGEVVFPALHGRWGEGGPLQDLLEAMGRPYVGSPPRAARLAMDKIASKSVAADVGLQCAPSCILDPADAVLPLPLPIVAKPIFEGSTVGLFVCHTPDQWDRAFAQACRSGQPYMIEPFIAGRELTLGLIAPEEPASPGANTSHPLLSPLPLIEITPADGLYDYDAKYHRDDTTYTLDPDVPTGVVEELIQGSVALAQALGVRHLCRTDFILDDMGRAWFLEINTMPGFTAHSLVPQAARAAGLDMPELCRRLVQAACAQIPEPVRS